MGFSIRYKLLLVLLLSTALVVLVMVGFTSWSFQRGFTDFIDAAQQERVRTLTLQLAEIHAEEQGWERLASNPRRWSRLVWSRGDNEQYRKQHEHEHHHESRRSWRERDDDDRPRAWPPRYRGGPSEEMPFAFRVMLFDADKSLIYGKPERAGQARLYPIMNDGVAVGYLGVLPGPPLSQRIELRFLERQRNAFIFIGIGMLLPSAIIALALAGRLVKPLRAFTDGAKALAAGRYATRIPVSSADELGQMARDFNALAAALEQHEQQRRQWVADISHELRTPMTVMRGELEALQDGVRPFTPAAVSSLHTDVLRLGRLVDDLYELSRSDLGALDYHKQPSNPLALLEDDLEALRGAFEERHLSLVFDNACSTSLSISADADRLSQLFRNLLNNSLHHTDAGGRIAISAQCPADCLVIDFQDSAPGVTEEQLPKLFERLYRVEPSRSRLHGGAGLGLAICRNIAEAHGGSITAGSSPLGGLWIQLKLPV